ncbi:MAG TPA: LysM domain-containing protein [Anaerolineales bacterium]|nr:LysM domain-containing protein [Anaerolineales bacterium]
MAPRRLSILAILIAILAACSSTSNSSNPSPTYNPFVPLSVTPNADQTAIPSPTRTPGPTPTRAALSVTRPAPRDPNLPPITPTADSPHALPTLRQNAEQYTVADGDTLGDIAQKYGISVEALEQANGISDPNLIAVGQTLNVPQPLPAQIGSSFKIIPDSELVYGPASAQFDVAAYIQDKHGYLASYTEAISDPTLPDINGQPMTGAQIITQVAQDYSVNPRLLLALIEYRSRWVTDPNPATLDYPLGFNEPNHVGLYHQLTWTANELNRGFYLWRSNEVANWVLAGDGSIVPIDPTINAGTAGIQNLFSKLDDRKTWETDVNAFGLFETYFFLFGSPFDYAIEPLIPPGLTQPRLQLPFEPGVTWAFTAGPHESWDSGTNWGALDFAPTDVQACATASEWETAVADGWIVRSSNGAVLEDLDNDGYEQTGWDILYMHVAAQDRVQGGTYVYAGDRLGHPSCEGGIANASHLHLVRKYNGEWIAADGDLPFILDGWVSSGNGTEYDGYLKRGSVTLEAAEGISDSNQISR